MTRNSNTRSPCGFLCASAPLRETIQLFVFLGAGVFACAARGENWERFRGPNGAGQSDASGIPTEWSADNFIWKRPLPGVGHSSPVIWGDRLFILSGDTSTG